LGATLEPGYTHLDTELTDRAGHTTRESTDLVTQRYRLSLDRSLTDRLDASAGGTFLDERAWTDTDGTWSDSHGRTTTLFGRLSLGTQVLNAGVGAERREQSALGTATPDFVTKSYTAYATWRPLEIPELDARASHVDTFDEGRLSLDSTSDSAAFAVRYDTIRSNLRYLLTWNRTADHLRDSRTTSVEQAVLGTRSDTLFHGRTTTYLSGTVQGRNVLTEAGVAGATVARQQLPTAGLSAIEAFPAVTDDIALTPNPLVIDGNVTTSAGVNVGFGPTVAGDRDARDVGVRFGDATTAVNTLYVWFDRPLSAEVARALAATVQVYQSVDNQHWTAVAVTAPPVPSPIENRIEVTTVQVQSTFLKVVLRPLAAGVTTEATFREVLVTELQLLLVVPAASVPRRQSAIAANATGYARTVLLRAPDLAYDVSASVAYDSDNARTRYSLVNGLTTSHPFARWLTGTARGARLDQDSGRGHEGSWEWSASLVGRPLPTAYWTLTYSGRAAEQITTSIAAPGASPTTTRETIIGHSVTALGRADWYEGISTQASTSYSISMQGERTGQAFQASGTTSLTPNTVVTLSVGGLYSRSVTSTPETGDLLTQFARADATVSLTPAPALSGAGTVSRVLIGGTPTTLGTLQLNYFPLQGDVQLSFAYSSNFDTAADARTQILTPSLRWNVRRGVSLTTSYTWLRNVAPVQTLVQRAFVATLLITW
jgi:hypothetical protein